jgi:hypothetical protein
MVTLKNNPPSYDIFIYFGEICEVLHLNYRVQELKNEGRCGDLFLVVQTSRIVEEGNQNVLLKFIIKIIRMKGFREMDLEILRKAIESDKVEEAESIFEEVGKNKQENAIPLLIEYLKSTDNHRLRNSIAITLSDIGSDKAIEPLIEMINNPKTLGYRGTLLYALNPFDCSAHLETLVYHLLSGNFEVQSNSYQLIEENIKSDVTDEVLLKCILKVKKELEEIERQQDIVSDALEMLFSIKKI